MLGVGFAAWRDVGDFFKTLQADDFETPIRSRASITRSIARGVSQSGNFLRGWLHMGFNQAEEPASWSTMACGRSLPGDASP